MDFSAIKARLILSASIGPLWLTELGTGFGDRFEDVEGRSGLSEGGVRVRDEVPE
jgi:hypothetical protein